MALTIAQAREIAKYPAAYQRSKYRMSRKRAENIERTLREIPWRGSYLDVGCGRGEMLRFASGIGVKHVIGVETVDALIGGNVVRGLAWALPYADKTFEIVSLLDVIEHLLPGDDERACRELARVASKTILITANNLSSMCGDIELHVNKRPYEEWDRLFREWCGGKVTWLRHRVANKSELWRVDLP